MYSMLAEQGRLLWSPQLKNSTLRMDENSKLDYAAFNWVWDPIEKFITLCVVNFWLFLFLLFVVCVLIFSNKWRNFSLYLGGSKRLTVFNEETLFNTRNINWRVGIPCQWAIEIKKINFNSLFKLVWYNFWMLVRSRLEALPFVCQ